MRPVLAAVLLGEPMALACSLEDYSTEPPEPDLGFVEGKSPPSPEVVEAYVYLGGFEESGTGCPIGPQSEDSCDGEYSYLRLRLRDVDEAVAFALDPAGDYVEYFHPAAVGKDGTVVVEALPWGELPLAFELTAYDADGYASRPVSVEVTREVDERPNDGACAVGSGSGTSRWLIVLGLLLAGRRLNRRSPAGR